MSTFLTSDLHFSHKILCENIRKMSVEDNNNLIINNWNKTVHKQDTVLILGDVTMDDPKVITEIMPKLKGNKVIIGGNHDTLRCCKTFMKLGIPVLGCMEYKGFILSHVPLNATESSYYTANIHGHLHMMNTRDINHYGFYYYNVNTEFHNYTPVRLEDIREFYNVK